MVLEVVADAPGLAHAAGGQDDRPGLDAVDRLAVLGTEAEGQPGVGEQGREVRGLGQRVAIPREHLASPAPPAANPGTPWCRAPRPCASGRRMVASSSWLRSTAKAGISRLPPAASASRISVPSRCPALLDRQVLAVAIAIGALDQQHVDSPVPSGSSWKVVSSGPMSPENSSRSGRPRSIDLHLERGRAQDVGGVPVAHADTRAGLEPSVVGDRPRLLEAALGVAPGVDRLDQRPAALPVAPVQPLDLELLDVAAVRQHEAQQVDGRLGGVDRAVEAGPPQLGEEPRMVGVGMGEQHMVDRPVRRTGTARSSARGSVLVPWNSPQSTRNRPRSCSTR